MNKSCSYYKFKSYKEKDVSFRNVFFRFKWNKQIILFMKLFPGKISNFPYKKFIFDIKRRMKNVAGLENVYIIVYDLNRYIRGLLRIFK